MSLVKQKSLTFEPNLSNNTDSQLNASYESETNTIILDCNEGTTWYLSEEIITQLQNSFNVKIINIYKNINKPIKLIYCNCVHFGNRVCVMDKNNNLVFGNENSENIFKFPLFISGIPHLNQQNNKYIEQSFYLDSINGHNYCITNIKNAF